MAIGGQGLRVTGRLTVCPHLAQALKREYRQAQLVPDGIIFRLIN
jgi:hypothetical protein